MNPYSDICANRHGGNTESIDANIDTARKKARDRALITDFFRRHGPHICEEAEAALDMSHQTCSARISELKADGILEPTKDRRETRTGSMARVLKLASEDAPTPTPTTSPQPEPVKPRPKPVPVVGAPLQGSLFDVSPKP